jgi:hypothetical protein
MPSKQWAKSTYSSLTNTCLEARWAKSTYSTRSTTCVEARTNDGVVQVRDSKLGDTSPILEFPLESWREFLDGVAAGEFTQTALTRPPQRAGSA